MKIKRLRDQSFKMAEIMFEFCFASVCISKVELPNRDEREETSNTPDCAIFPKKCRLSEKHILY